MRNSIILTLFLLPIALLAQVGIGTTSPNASAKLDVTSTSQGFLPPRVALTATSDATTIKNTAGTSITPATGLFVYNTATAGSSPSNVTPGLYYYDGSKWQRVINQQPDATIEFNQLTPTTASVVFTPNTPSSKDFVYVSTVDASQWTYNGTTYITYTPPASTAWNLAGGTTDAGSNKTGAILRTGNVGVGPTTPPTYPGYTSMAISNATNGGVLDFLNGSNRVGTIYNDASKFIIGTVGATANTIPLVFIAGGSGSERMRITGTGNVGIGTTTPSVKLDARATSGDGALGIGTSSATASTTGAGALRYSTSSGGILEYSNGTAWNTLTSTVTKSTVIASKNSTQTINSNTPTTVVGWTEIVDNNNTFDPSTGVFTAPRTGNYVFNFSYAFTGSDYSTSRTVIEAWMQCSDVNKLRKQLLAAPINVTSQRCGALISFVVNLLSGETLSAAIWHDTGVSRSLEINGGGAGFVNISIVEL